MEISLLMQLKEEGKKFLYAIIILGSMGISFFTPFFYTLSLYYPMRKEFKKKYPVVIYCIAAVFSILIVLSFPQHYILDKLLFPSSLRDISLKNLPFLFAVLYFLLTSFSILLLFFSTKNFLSSIKADIIPYEKNTVCFLTIIGIPLAYLLSIVGVINYFFNIPFPWIGIFLGVFTLFIVVLIFRFHLVDMKRLMSGVLFFPALIAILVFIYISLILKNQDRIAQMLALPVNVTLILEVFIIYLVVSTLKRFLDITFIRRKFPNVSMYRDADIEPMEYLSYALTIQNLYHRLKEVFRIYSKIEKVFLLIYDKEKQAFLNADKHNPFSLSASREFIDVLVKLNRGVTLEELLIYMNRREHIEQLHSAGVNLLLPIRRGDGIHTLILLPKRSIIRRWSHDDICSLNYLRVIMPALIDRCKMYENEKEIEKHEYKMEQFMVIGQMASGLAHEIRNPLSIISTSVETILRDGIDEKDRKKMLQYIQEEANRINILADKLLSLSFQQKPTFQTTDLPSILTKLKTFLSYKLKDKNITLIFKNNEPCTVYSDPNILFQIFLNLILNSIEAVKYHGTICMDYLHDGNTVTVFIEDTGPGIPAKIRDKIFEPFFTMKKEGSGLGLTVSRKLAGHLYGSLDLMLTKRGTCFKTTLPILKEKPLEI
jgi:signal transduction histidine kinase